jgi:AcrR family transcriptional regulator
VPATRERIITATNELFRRGGYNGTSLRQVTDAAGVPTGSLYHFFPRGKAELAEAVIVETGASYLELFELIAAAAADAGAAVGDFFDAAAETLEQSDYIDVCPIGTVAREVANTNDRLRHAADRVFMSWIESLGTRLEAAGLPTPEATALATTVIAAFEGGLVLARTRRDADVLRDTGHHVRQLVDAQLRDVRNRAQVGAPGSTV